MQWTRLSRDASIAGSSLRLGLPCLLLLAGPLACERRAPEEATPAAVARTAPPAPKPAEPPLRYRRLPIPGPKALLAARDSLGPAAFREVLAINRRDLAHVLAGDSLVVPVGPPVDPLRHAPFPRALAAADSLPKLLLVSLRVQAFGAYEHGALARWGPTSTGKRASPTPARLYYTNWKDKERTSTVNGDWLMTWYVNLDNFQGISLHQYDLPGYPASHSCIRLLEDDARWIYDWAEQWRLTPDSAGVASNGTPVVVFGAYAYGRRPPWKRLPENPEATAVPLPEIETALRAYPDLGRRAEK
jgi:hypothetical protein